MSFFLSDPIATRPTHGKVATLPAGIAPARDSSGHPATPSDARRGLVVRHLPSLSEIARESWDTLFPGKAEGWDYFQACERAAPAESQPSALVAYADGIAVAAAPVFRTSYRLDLELPAGLRPYAGMLGRIAPRLTKTPVLVMGSPLTEECPVGFHPEMGAAHRGHALTTLLDGMTDLSRSSGISMLALKDIADSDARMFDDTLMPHGFTRVPTLPVATLHLPYEHEDQYLAALSPNMRRDLKKKMKSLGKVSVEICHSIDGIEDEIIQLFQETKAKSKADYDGFDDVPDDYFRHVVAGLGDKALIVLCRVDGVLAGFSLSLVERNRIIGKYVGMRYPLAREHDVYFINWMTIVRYCIAHGIAWMQTGQTTYNQKLRLGCRLKRSWVYFRHRGLFAGPVVRAVGRRLRFDQMDPDLRNPAGDLPYLDPEPSPAMAPQA